MVSIEMGIMRILKKQLWPYKIAISDANYFDKILDIEFWLAHRVGGFKDHWNAVYKHDGTDFYFRDSRDATMFALKWS